MHMKRVIVCLIAGISVYILLLGRLMEIQLFTTKAFSKHHINLLEESVKQRSQELMIDSGRGHFLDRNGESLTGQKIRVLVLFPFLKNLDWDAEKLAYILNIRSQTLKATVEKIKDPVFFKQKGEPFELTALQAKRINALHIPGVFAVEKVIERSSFPAKQLIGVTGENEKEAKLRYPDQLSARLPKIGVSGLEQSFDEFLLSEGKSKLIFHVDGNGDPLFGMNVKYSDSTNPFYPVNVITTIDKNVQEKAESLVDHYKIKKGGLVLLNLKDNSILAMVSRPDMDKEDPYRRSGIANLMVKQQIIGSVFKTVVAAAAVDYQLASPNRMFDCSKKITGAPEYQYRYGTLNFTDSFSRSCNHTFGQLAQELKQISPGILEDYAAKLSLLGPAGWTGAVYHTRNFQQMADEERGRVYLSQSDQEDDLFAAQTGIGQHEVRATPLAVANMMATIARGGKKEMVRAVTKIQYKNGTTMLEFPMKRLPGKSISPYTAMRLQKLLREVVESPDGTGRWLQNLPYEVAGKSGTAETGKYQNGVQLHNKWFAGYFPYQDPKYALVAVNLDVHDGEGGVIGLFADMVKLMHQIDQEHLQ